MEESVTGTLKKQKAQRYAMLSITLKGAAQLNASDALALQALICFAFGENSKQFAITYNFIVDRMRYSSIHK